MSEAKQCEWVDAKPLTISVCEDYEITATVKGYGRRCNVLADPGEQFCPKHKIQDLLEQQPKGKIV